MENHIHRSEKVGVISPATPTAQEDLEQHWTAKRVRQCLRDEPGGLRVQAATNGTARSVVAWHNGLSYPDAGLIRMYASGTTWKRICSELGMSRATANRHLQ